MSKQINLFGFEDDELDNTYSKKISAPIYEPKGNCPNILELVDTLKSNAMIREISASNVTDGEKAFLTEAAKRHNVFSYSKIAEYYAHASPEMQNLMEKSALVIIDFNKAIEYGFAKLSEEIAEQFMEDNNENI